MYSLICIFGYVKINIVSYISNPFRCTTCTLCLTGTLFSNKPDSHMLTYITPSNSSCHIPIMRTGVSALQAVVLICTRNDFFFAITGLVGGGVCEGVWGACQVVTPWREFNFQLQINAATKLWVKSLQWKQRQKEGYFAICAVAKLLPKEK